jgi:hypothetical protein
MEGQAEGKKIKEEQTQAMLMELCDKWVAYDHFLNMNGKEPAQTIFESTASIIDKYPK